MLEVTSIVKRFGQKIAVSDISFSLEAGHILGFVGKNGAGKTTTLSIIATLLKPNSGFVRVSGFDTQTQADNVRKRIGIFNGNMKLPTRLSVYEALEYQGYLHGMNTKQITQRIVDLSQRLSIDYLKVRCETLSTGMAQRVLIARAFLHNPSLLLLDEASNGLDVVARGELQDVVQTFAKDGCGIIYSTHILSELENFASKTAVIRSGHIIDLFHGFDTARTVRLLEEKA